MVRVIRQQQMTSEKFFDWYADSCDRYELWNGATVEMQPTGQQEQVISLLDIIPYFFIDLVGVQRVSAPTKTPQLFFAYF